MKGESEVALYYPKTHSCGGKIDIYPGGYGLCTQCNERIEPASKPDPSWGNGYSVITVPVVPEPILDFVRHINTGQRPLREILEEIDAQNEEGRERGSY